MSVTKEYLEAEKHNEEMVQKSIKEGNMGIVSLANLKVAPKYNCHPNLKDGKVQCDVSNKRIDLMEGFLVYNHTDKEWTFQCSDTGNEEKVDDYAIDCERFFKSHTHTLSWLVHLSEKTWFNKEQFLEFLIEFTVKNNLRIPS